MFICVYPCFVPFYRALLTSEASNIGTEHFVGQAGAAAEGGLAVAIYEWSAGEQGEQRAVCGEEAMQVERVGQMVRPGVRCFKGKVEIQFD